MNGLILNQFKSAHEIYQQEGILYYPRVFEGDELTRLRDACEFIRERHLEELEQTHPQSADENGSMKHLNHAQWRKLHFDHWKTIVETVADPRCLGPVEQIFRGPSLFRSTQLFFNPRRDSREGYWHRDIQSMVKSEDEVKALIAEFQSNPEKRTLGIQFQIALIDNDDVEYVPFSAGRYDSPEEYYFRCADGRTHNRESGMPNAMRLHMRAGDAIAFNANGLHRGRYLADNPRRTLMISYTPRHQPLRDPWSDQPWTLEEDHLDGLSTRAKTYFEDFISVYQDSWTPN